MIGGVGKGFAAVGEGLVACVLVEACEVTHELAEVAGVGTVLSAVLASEVEDLVQGSTG